ncbi:MAG: helix-turn-helix transcriptional regulator [Cyclobacteriaceae bacterium]|nr:helix-turn-helix transcriptional regulator [Cyclobacteriaceae bacterium HetDA_MAG_MS6]
MIREHQQFELFGKKILERAVFQAPVREPRALSNEACFLYSVQGTMQLHSSTERVKLSSKQGIVMRCGNYLASHIKTNDYLSEAIAVHFYPEVLKQIYKEGIPKELLKRESPFETNRQIARVDIDRMVSNYVEGLLFYFKNPQLIDDELMKLKIKELIMLLINTESTYSKQVQGILTNLFSPVEASLKEVVQAHLYDNLTLEELAALSNLSLSTFKRKFQSIYEENPATYFRQQRLKKASELLKHSDRQVKEVCYESGFNDITSFTKLFTKQYGHSPSEFRRQTS